MFLSAFMRVSYGLKVFMSVTRHTGKPAGQVFVKHANVEPCYHTCLYYHSDPIFIMVAQLVEPVASQ